MGRKDTLAQHTLGTMHENNVEKLSVILVGRSVVFGTWREGKIS